MPNTPLFLIRFRAVCSCPRSGRGHQSARERGNL